MKKNIFTRLSALVLAALMTVSMLPVTALAADGVCDGKPLCIGQAHDPECILYAGGEEGEDGGGETAETTPVCTEEMGCMADAHKQTCAQAVYDAERVGCTGEAACANDAHWEGCLSQEKDAQPEEPTEAEADIRIASVEAQEDNYASPAYTMTDGFITNTNGQVKVWGEAYAVAPAVSLVYNLYSSGTKIASTKLENVNNIISGNPIDVTWHFDVLGECTDAYWTTTWEPGHPNAGAKPDMVTMHIDGNETPAAAKAIHESRPDDLVPVVWEQLFAAEYNGKTYGSIQAAVDAAGTAPGAKIKVLHNITKQPENNITIADGQDVVIDLNGKTVDGYFWVNGHAHIKNGTIRTSAYKSGIEINASEDNAGNGGNHFTPELTVEGLTITSPRHALRIDGGMVRIISGSYTSQAAGGTHHAVNISSNADVTIESGTFVGYGTSTNGNAALAARGEQTMVTIRGGEFKNDGGSHTIAAWGGVLNISGGIFHKSATDTLNMGGGDKGTSATGITGGYFEDKPDTALLQTDKAAMKITTGAYAGWYEIGTAAAKVGEEPYVSIQDAINDTTGTQTITLLKEQTGQSLTLDTADGPREITLDLGTNSLTGTITFQNAASRLTIQGTGGQNDITLTAGTEPGEHKEIVWYKDGRELEAANSIKAANGAYHYQIEDMEYTITFDTGGDSPIAPITQRFGQPITKSADPVRTGYAFQGWVNSDNAAEEIPDTMPGRSYTLKAVWEASRYAISYELNGGIAGENAPVIHTYGTATTLVNPAKKGYRFEGWFISGDFSGSAVETLAADGFTADVKLYAKWAEKAVLNPGLETQSVTYTGLEAAYQLDGGYTIAYQQEGKTVKPVDAGKYDVVITRPEDDTYQEFSAVVPEGLEIRKAKLTARYESEVITQFEEPKRNVLVSGFVNQETPDTAAGYIHPVMENVPTAPGAHDLKPVKGEARNYVFEYESGTLFIARYVITHGGGQTVVNGSQAVFHSNASHDKLVGVMVDGKWVEKGSYTDRSGSTIVTLKAPFVKSLGTGTHTLAVVSADGFAYTTFTVKNPTLYVPGDTLTQTGSITWPAAVLAAAGVLTMAAGAWFALKKKGEYEVQE